MVKYVIYVLPQLKCCLNLQKFPPNPNSKIFRIDKKLAYCNSGAGPVVSHFFQDLNLGFESVNRRSCDFLMVSSQM